MTPLRTDGDVDAHERLATTSRCSRVEETSQEKAKKALNLPLREVGASESSTGTMAEAFVREKVADVGMA